MAWFVSVVSADVCQAGVDQGVTNMAGHSPPPALQRSPAIALLIALRELLAGSHPPQSCLAPPGSNFQRPLVNTRPGVAPDLYSFIARLYIREANPYMVAINEDKYGHTIYNFCNIMVLEL